MSYAVLQKEIERPPFEVLKQLLVILPKVTQIDAARMANHAFGILARGLSLEDANRFKAAYQSTGLTVDVVEENQLAGLPDPKFLNRLGFTPEALLVYDPLGRPSPVEWRHVSAIVAGQISHFKTTIKRTPEPVELSDANHVWSGDDYVMHKEHKVESATKVDLEILIAEGRMRFCIEAKKFLYGHALQRSDLEYPDNLAMLVQMLAQHSPQATLNRGASALNEQQGLGPVYPTSAAFAEETIWLLHRRQNQAPHPNSQAA